MTKPADTAALLALAERFVAAVDRLADAAEAQRPRLPPEEAQALGEFLRAVHAVTRDSWRADALLNLMQNESSIAWHRVYDATTSHAKQLAPLVALVAAGPEFASCLVPVGRASSSP